MKARMDGCYKTKVSVWDVLFNIFVNSDFYQFLEQGERVRNVLRVPAYCL